MLRIEKPDQAAYFKRSNSGNGREFGTLDDIPDFALSSLSQLYNYLLRPFQKSYGIIIYGPLDPVNDDEWGRRVELPSSETLQIKFSPIRLLQDCYDGVALISVKLSGCYGSTVKTTILFSPKTNAPSPNILINRLCDELGPRGLHMLNISFFNQHEWGEHAEKPSSSLCTMDIYGYSSVRSTTFSMSKLLPPGNTKTCKKSRRVEFSNFNHSKSHGVSPGPSIFLVAGQFNNVEITKDDLNELRSAEPVNEKEYSRIFDRASKIICRGDQAVGRSAIAASISVCELLSGEGLISMMSNSFFRDSLPSNLKSPLGAGLIICMAVRIAMVPGLHGQCAGSVADQIACSEIRTLFESQFVTIPIAEQYWAIDFVISSASKQAEKNASASSKSFDGKLRDQLVYWHRAGQGIISSLFGLWTSTDFLLPGRHGKPWRFHDPLIDARTKKTVDLTDFTPHTFDPIREEPEINFASIAKRRTTLIKLLIDTENYLRTGMFEGKQLVAPNDETKQRTSPQEFDRSLKAVQERSVSRENDGDTVTRGPSFTNEQLQDAMFSAFNINALNQARVDVAGALFSGPIAIHKHKIGSYLVSEFQESPCCDCGDPVHVLQGILLAHSFSSCPSCHAKRCISCSSSYSFMELIKKRQMAANKGESKVAYGSACRTCGAPPFQTPVTPVAPS